MKKDAGLTYKKSGVDYSVIDPVKVLAQKAARPTARHIRAAGFPEVEASRGESAYVFDAGDFFIASITECLGTKSLVAEEVASLTGKYHYDSIAQDTLAMALNDLCTVGARPLSVHAYWAVGGSDFFSDRRRVLRLVAGWRRACDNAGVSWGGGETPSLSGIIERGACDLAASCVGVVSPKERLTLGERLASGDAIVLLESSGIHANGLTLAREVARRLPRGYLTRVGRRTYGDALLEPTILYSPLVESLFSSGIGIHYMSNITGHGWRKVMRHARPFTYRIERLPPVPPVLEFLAREARLGPAEAYGSLNMGAGFALFVASRDASRTVAIAKRKGFGAHECGVVEKGKRKVTLEPLGLTFEGGSMKVRG